MNANFESALQSQITELEERRTTLSAELARVDGHLSGLRQALSLYRGEQNTGSGITERMAAIKGNTISTGAVRGSRVPDPRKSAAWAFALEAMENAPDDGINIDELDATLKEAGHELARATLRANLSNAAKEGVIQRVRYGRYRKTKPLSAEPNDEASKGTESVESGAVEQNT